MIREVKPTEVATFCELCEQHALDAGLVEHDQLDKKFVKTQIKKVMINPNMHILVYVDYNDKMLGYAVGAGKQKIWNGTLYSELLLFFVHPGVRKGTTIADELFLAMQDWFIEVGCLYMQASNMIYNKEFEPDTEWLNKGRNYFKKQEMAEVGYHFVKNLEDLRWVE